MSLAPSTVIVEGPTEGFTPEGDQYPEWVIYFADQDGEECEEVKPYRVKSRDRAVTLAQKIAKDRRLEFQNCSCAA